MVSRRLQPGRSPVRGRRPPAVPPLGIGVIGAGTAALHAHLPAIAATPGARLVGLCDRDPARLATACRRWPEAAATRSLASLLASPGLQALIVATPPASHQPIACAALERGLHVLIEKPLAPDLAACRQIQRAASRRGVVVRVGHEKRFHPTLECVGALLRRGAIGTPYYGGVHWASNAKLDPERLVPAGYRHGYQWRWTDPTAGGGILHDHLPHYVDLIAHWLQTRPQAVTAQTFNIARDRLGWSARHSRWEDLSLALVRFANGFVLRFETGVVGRSLSPLWGQGSGIGEWTEYGYLLGTGGQLLFDLLPWDSCENGRIAIWRLAAATRKRAGWTLIEQPEPARATGSPAGAAHAMFCGQLRAWLRAIAGQSDRAAGLGDGVLALATVVAGYRSAAWGRECAIRTAPPREGRGRRTLAAGGRA